MTCFIAVGQCGNQISRELRATANLIQVDSESKVVDKKRGIYEQSGRGSNWALGYNGYQTSRRGSHRHSSHASQPLREGSKQTAWDSGGGHGHDLYLVHQVKARLRKLFEHGGADYTDSGGASSTVDQHKNYTSEEQEEQRRDRPTTTRNGGGIKQIVLLHSVAGGTGSGLGSRLLEEIADLYPRHRLASAAILPLRSCGSETCLQSYNACLTAAWMQEFCDANLLFENEHLLFGTAGGSSTSRRSGVVESCNQISEQHRASSSGKANNAFSEANRQVGEVLNSLDWDSLFTHVCPMRQLHFAQAYAYSLPKSGFVKSNLTSREHDEHLQFLRRHVLPSALPQTPGENSKRVLFAAHARTRGINGGISFPSKNWIPGYEAAEWNRHFAYLVDQGREMNADVAMTINWSRSGDLLSAFLTNARKKYRGRCFLHALENHGVYSQDVEAALDVVDAVVSKYREG
ncbi:unnamed protein product [Amoebophrya sp. A25]|nr:unnamed protein product [Amoebophrya sp. A25]|eukprot:GSA25T00020955001.1